MQFLFIRSVAWLVFFRFHLVMDTLASLCAWCYPPLRSRLSPIKSAHAKHTTNGQWGLGFSRTPYCIRSLIFDGEKTSQAFSDNSCTINTFVPFCCVSALSYRASRLVLSGWHHFISLYRKRKERFGKVRFEAITHKRMTNEIICSVVASEDFNFFPF